jgi:3-oxoacyl-[acyl-carrier-protein] synthase II
MNDVVVTGMGAVTPLGENIPASWHSLIGGQNADEPVEHFDTTGCRCHRAANAALPLLPEFSTKELRRLPRAARLAIPAVKEALTHAMLLDKQGKCRLPILNLSVSTTAGGMALGEGFLRGVLAQKRGHLFSQVSRYLPHEQVLDIQKAFDFEGPAIIIANACASGANAIGHAYDLISTGAADCVLAGGFEALTELVYVGFDCLQATTMEKCRPFDLNRSGLLLGEGAAFLVIESKNHAARRGITPICRITGYSHTTDYFHLTQPQPEGKILAQVMKEVISQGSVSPTEIGYVNAHGTGTVINDPAEASAYRLFFGDALPQTRISSTKAAIGHTLGAAGTIEAVFTIQTLQTHQIPPQIHLQTPLPEMAHVLAMTTEPPRDFRHAMSVNLGFGGSNAALLFSRHEN